MSSSRASSASPSGGSSASSSRTASVPTAQATYGTTSRIGTSVSGARSDLTRRSLPPPYPEYIVALEAEGENVSELFEDGASDEGTGVSSDILHEERTENTRQLAETIRERLMARAQEYTDKYPGDVRAQYRDDERRRARIRADYIRRLWQEARDSREARASERRRWQDQISRQRQTRAALPPSIQPSREQAAVAWGPTSLTSRATSAAITSDISYRTARDFPAEDDDDQGVPSDRPWHEVNPYRDIKRVGDIPPVTLRYLEHFRDHSERAQFRVQRDGHIVYIAPRLPPPASRRKWHEGVAECHVVTELERTSIADHIPFVQRLVDLDQRFTRYQRHLALQENPLLWQMPPNIVAAARRVYVDRGTAEEIEMERVISRNAKQIRRMGETHVPGTFTRGSRGTPQITATWAFVWAIKQGLMPELAREDFDDGFPILPACVAALVIERAHCSKARPWRFLLWRAIFSERLRREVEMEWMDKFGQLPQWTSTFSHAMWDAKVGRSQKPEFGFAQETRFDTCYGLHRRFEDARIAFRRTIRYLRASLYK